MNCKAKTAAGDPCKMPATKGGKFCFTHSPAHRRAQAEARKRGGQARHTQHAGNPESIPARIESIEDARALLAYVMVELLAHDNSIPRARALLALFDSFVKALEIGEIEKRLQALEARAK
jgi:hypothetical protein